MNGVSNVSFRIDTELKNQADELFQELGLNMTTAFNMFLRQSVREGRIPFEVKKNAINKETIKAMAEAIQLVNSNEKGYTLVEALEEIKKWN